MKKIYLQTFCLGILSLGLAACSSNDQDALQDDVTFSIAASIQGITRAPQLDATGAGTFANGDVNTLFFQNGNGALEKTFSYTHGNSYYWNDLGLDHPIDGLKVSACYPPADAANPQAYTWDVTSAKNLTPDLLAAPATALKQNVTEQVNLKFNHLMHQFAVKLETDGTSVAPSSLNTAVLTLSQWLPAATINLLTAEVLNATGAPTQKVLTGGKGSFILPPQSVGEIKLNVQVENHTQTFKLSDIQIDGKPVNRLESGKILSLTIKVSKESFTITGQTINGWESQGEANGEIII